MLSSMTKNQIIVYDDYFYQSTNHFHGTFDTTTSILALSVVILAEILCFVYKAVTALFLHTELI